MMILAPSILAADFTQLGNQIREIEQAGAGYLHLDVMDGCFVPSISFGMPIIKSLRGASSLFFDVHMMVEEPGRYVDAMKEAGADSICIHAEACRHLDRTVNQIREAGLKAAIALNPATPLTALEYILNEVSMILIMTVNPGFGGQKFIPYTLEKVRALRQTCEHRNISMDIEVDGGVTLSNARELMEAGANVFVAGSAVFHGDVTANTKAFLKQFQESEGDFT